MIQVASDPKIEGYGNMVIPLTLKLPNVVASDPKIEGYGNYAPIFSFLEIRSCK